MKSEFEKQFDEIEVDDKLKKRLEDRIDSDKIASRPSNQRRVKRKSRFRRLAVTAAVVLAFVIAIPSFAFIGNAVYNPSYDFSRARAVKNEKKLLDVLSVKAKNDSFVDSLFGGLSKNLNLGGAAVQDSAPSSVPESNFDNTADAEESYSKTNVQVDGMDEGDLVKNDGRYIYRFSNSGFSVTEVNKGQMTVVSQIEIDSFNPIEMYISGSQLVLIGGGYTNMPYYYADSLMNGGYMDCFNYHTNVEIRVYDLSVIESPSLTFYYQIEGNYMTSRIQESTNTLYFVINYYNNYYYYNDDMKDMAINELNLKKRPYQRNGQNETAEPLAISDIYYFKSVPSTSYLILGAIDLDNNSKEPNINAYLSDSGTIYVSGDYLYMSVTQNFYSFLSGIRSSQKSYISKFSLNDLTFMGSNFVLGRPKDRYCLDEYNGYLRVATSYFENVSDWGSQFANGVYVFDKSMKKVSSIMGIAEGEQIDSATFSGDKGYISTSVRMVDPLFIIDFSDVLNPTISQGLKEDGINLYMKALGDSGYVIGLGRENDGLKLQLYDMNGEEAVSNKKLTIDGNCSYAEALYNPKAILYMYDENTMTGLFGFAAERSGYSASNGYNFVVMEQGFYLYSFDAKLGTMDFVGLLTGFDRSPILDYSSDYDWETVKNDYLLYVSRGIVIGDYIYTISHGGIMSYKLDGLEKVGEV